MTGSIGVVTINLVRIAYESESKSEFKSRLWQLVNIAKNSLEIKRKIIEKQTESGMYPYCAHYLRNIKARTGQYWFNHFNTIGIIGMNEACLNFFGDGTDLTDAKGQDFAIDIMNYLRELISKMGEETGHFYNLEATPAEGTSYRLASIDKEKYPQIICAGTEETPYYTNSTQLPVAFTDDIFETLDLQDELQSLYTGGTVLHLYLGESISDIEVAKEILRKAFTNYKLPYLSFTPTFSVCPSHGYISGEHFNCPLCGKSSEVWSRVVGYLRPVQNYNKGKKVEYAQRVKFDLRNRTCV
jgi:ribonucleoside-triphosphate reductase